MQGHRVVQSSIRWAARCIKVWQKRTKWSAGLVDCIVPASLPYSLVLRASYWRHFKEDSCMCTSHILKLPLQDCTSHPFGDCNAWQMANGKPSWQPSCKIKYQHWHSYISSYSLSAILWFGISFCIISESLAKQLWGSVISLHDRFLWLIELLAKAGLRDSC